MNRKKMFSGIYPAIVSPVDEDGAVLESELRALVRYFSKTSVQGVYACGGTGEGILLPIAVRKRITEIIIDEAGKCSRSEKMKVIVHIGAAESANTKELVEHAAAAGADALSAIPPIYFTYSKEKICEYYTWIASLSNVPLIIYASAQAGTAFTAAMVEELSAVPTIKGIKFTGYNFYELLKMREAAPDDFSILNGGDEVLIFGLLAGADGGIGATYNVMPEKFCSLYSSWIAGEIEQARAKQIEINEIIDLIISYPVIGAVKFMLTQQGFAVGEPVFPNDSLTAEQQERFIEQIKEIENLEA